KLDMQLRKGERGAAFERDKAAALHFLRLADLKIRENLRELGRNADQSMLEAAAAQFALTDEMPNEDFYIHESSPTDRGTGRPIPSDHIRQFPGDGYAGGDGSASLPARDAAPKSAKKA